MSAFYNCLLFDSIELERNSTHLNFYETPGGLSFIHQRTHMSVHTLVCIVVLVLDGVCIHHTSHIT
jgi:hypothetical protein